MDCLIQALGCSKAVRTMNFGRPLLRHPLRLCRVGWQARYAMEFLAAQESIRFVVAVCSV